MTDITRKLELIATLKTGENLPHELQTSDWDWGPLISGICAEALAEIQRLRQYEVFCDAARARSVQPCFIPVETNGKPISEVVDPYGKPWGSPSSLERQWPKVFGKSATQVIIDDPHAPPEPAPEPWGSPFAMNTRNWR